MDNETTKNLLHTRFVLGVVAGKGGVGKSTVAVNLARAASKQGFRVGIIDADIYGPSLRHMLPEEIPPKESPSSPGHIIPAVSSGIKMISMAFFCEGDTSTAVRAPFANGLIGQFLHKVEWGELDLLLIDFPPGTGDIHLTIAQEIRLNGMVVVTTPQEISLLDVRKAIHMCDKMQLPILGVVENMSYWQESPDREKMFLFGEGGGHRLCEETGIPFLGEIPIEPRLAQAADRGDDIFACHPSCNAAQVLDQVSHKLLQHLAWLEQMEGQYLKNFELVWQ